MGAFPSGSVTKTDLDQGTDSPAAARIELAAVIDKINEIIASYAAASGLCDLDVTGKIPAARLPAGAGTGTDADLLDGQHGAYYQDAANLNAGTLPAARFADSAHGDRGGGTLHPAATQVVNGFMSATDKQAVDGIDADIAAAIAGINTPDNILSHIAAGAVVYAVGSYVFAEEENAVTTNPGDTRGGEYLQPAGINAALDTIPTYGTGMVGTWRCMGYSGAQSGGEETTGSATLWLRIS